MNALSLFGRDHVNPGEENPSKTFVSQGGWGFGRAWRDIQRSWGIDPGPEPEVIPINAGRQPGTTAGGSQEQEQIQRVDQAQNVAEGQEPWEQAIAGGKRTRRVGEEEDDEFYIEDEGDFGGTVAIIALCMLLA